MKNIQIVILFFLFTCFFISCKDEYNICDNTKKDVKFIGGFYERVAGVDVAKPAPNLTVYLRNNPTPIISNQLNIKEFSFALNPLADSAQYILSLGSNLIKDTLTIVYLSQTYNNYDQLCGPISLHTIDRIISTTNTIDSVKIVQPSVNTIVVQNAKIYF
jgi:Family of unknown function (DUF6452)